jgi:hypothetical protein
VSKVLIPIGIAALLVSIARPASASQTGHGFAVGGGEAVTGTNFGFAAHNNPQGSSGFFVATEQAPIGPGVSVAGKVTCLTVVGNSATLGIEITKSQLPYAPVGSGLFWALVDNGPPVSGQSADTVEATFTPTPPMKCPLLPATFLLSHGDVAVGA